MKEVRKQWNAALYARISRDDNSTEYSIENQKKRLYDFVDASHDEFQQVKLYVDIGASGSNSDREQFARMLNDVRKKRINCIIVKDLSRLSRNYYEAGYYLDYLFSSLAARFISLEYPALDSYKCPDMMNSVMVPMQNVVNDDFCRQTSIKVRNILKMKQKRGDFIGAFAPYGYSKHPDTKHRLVIDEEAADIIRMIFRWYVHDNMSQISIVRKLNHMGVACPGAYKQNKGLRYHNRSKGNSSPLWCLTTISGILRNQMYIGDMVQGRQRSQNYKTGKVVNVPQDEWIIVEDTHPAIIPQELFVRAQEKLQRKDKPREGVSHLFSGLVRCKGCHKAMARRPVSKYVYYKCRTYYEQSKEACSGHSIREDRLEGIIQNLLRIQTQLAGDTGYIQSAVKPVPVQNDYKCQVDRLIEQQQRRLKRLSHYKKSLYQDWKDSSITREEFDQYGVEYETEIAETKRALSALAQEKAGIPERQHKDNQQLAEFLLTGTLPKLTHGMLMHLIEKIEVDQAGDITVHFRYKDPLVELLESR